MVHTDQRCENCRFFDILSLSAADDRTLCLHCLPPIEVSREGYKTDWLFAKVNNNSRCGEWRPILEIGNISAYNEEFTKN